ncbi:hypothetical protein K440DRAFT_634325 [Wilcoxina mikolae CBS 423.85]|nr:hypothetical protein K440DRAFT_634325 [Wilcoxina mikolae CBS 423.85]
MCLILETDMPRFLLVNFQIDHILRQPTPKKKREALHATPKDLNATYALARKEYIDWTIPNSNCRSIH